MSNLTVRSNGGALSTLGQGPSILGEKPPTLQTAGSVRPGIMVLTKAHQNNEQARRIYERGVRAGVSWKLVGDTIKKKLALQKSPLTMKNAPFFYVKASDFDMPETAQAIMDAYGEPRREDDEMEVPGLEEKRLYRFPVIFPLDSWLACLPHQFSAWRASERRYWSEYVEGRRMCKMYAPVDVDPKTKRAKRPWGGRRIQLRPENEGICDPSECAQYQAEECNLQGRILFYIPGVPGGSLLFLPTRSWYSMNPIRSVMEEVLAVRGRLSGVRDDGQPLFWLTKVLDEVSRIDRQTGKAMRQRQHIIRLERNFDVAMIEHQEAAEDLEDAADTLEIPNEEPPPIDGDWMPVGEDDVEPSR